MSREEMLAKVQYYLDQLVRLDDSCRDDFSYTAECRSKYVGEDFVWEIKIVSKPRLEASNDE